MAAWMGGWMCLSVRVRCVCVCVVCVGPILRFCNYRLQKRQVAVVWAKMAVTIIKRVSWLSSFTAAACETRQEGSGERHVVVGCVCVCLREREREGERKTRAE
mmetsp:Transcript_25359/g.73242  ORF Transcript_25359/g.73242 Transcript_25359/m.73242 type:complete len:103 (+) Transcript_25359:973-1281(+)